MEFYCFIHWILKRFIFIKNANYTSWLQMYKLGVKQHEKHVILLYKYLYFTVFFWLPTLPFYMYFYGVWYKVKKTTILPI